MNRGCRNWSAAAIRSGLRGFSAIDFGRCVIASEALRSGFEELMWIDSDVVFYTDDLERLRAHKLPLVCGIYAKKGRRTW